MQQMSRGPANSIWSRDELARIEGVDEIKISARRLDGVLRRPTIVWVVRVGASLFVRSAHGLDAAWYRATRLCQEGHIEGGGVDRDVNFLDVAPDDPVHEEIDSAYRDRYRRYPKSYVLAVTTPDTHAVTLRLTPR